MAQCGCYKDIEALDYTYDKITGTVNPCITTLHKCYGTKEIDECSCGGDRAKCDFYEDVRQKAAEEAKANANRQDTNTTSKDKIDYKKLYVDMIKRYDDDICEKCKHNKPCLGRKCKSFDTGESVCDITTGRCIENEWTCQDFEFGTCDELIDTPCNGCSQDNYSHFELDENKIQ